MAVISVPDYKLLVTDYSAALAQIEGVSTNYYDAAYKVLLLNVFDPEIDLLVPFHNAYLVADVSFAAQPQSVVNAIQSLQQHILAKAIDLNSVPADANYPLKYTSINEFYADATANVSGGLALGADYEFTGYFTAAFAALSQQAGFTVESTYITA